MCLARSLLVTASVFVLGLGLPARAQEPRFYAGGTVSFITQPAQSEGVVTEQEIGGRTWGGSLVFGVRLTPQVGLEFEPSFGGRMAGPEYSYLFTPTLSARVVASGRDDFYSFLARLGSGVVQPVVGVSYVRATASTDFYYGSPGQIHDDWSSQTVAFVAGLDAAFKVAPHVEIVPAFRLFTVSRHTPPSGFYKAGSMVYRLGAGARASF